MDEEDFINDLGWNRNNLDSADVSGENDINVIESDNQVIASTSEVIISPQPETVESDNTAKSEESNKTGKLGRGRPPRISYVNLKPTRVGLLLFAV